MKGICFKEPLFHAVVNGTKTQTRRIVKTEKIFADGTRIHEYEDGSWGFFNSEGYLLERIKPKYQVGERVYLKEPYYVSQTGIVFYKYENKGLIPSEQVHKPWANKLFMPEKYARYFIEITGVRYERLQDISDYNCIKEGIIKKFIDNEFSNVIDETKCFLYGYDKNSMDYKSPQKAYAVLIDKISGKGTWDSNPYVWVYDFKLFKN